jgi:glycosyltransferase involved in cell wall biosynthesis
MVEGLKVRRLEGWLPVDAKMRTTKPRLSIGLPVYNGENYLAQALDSILAQTYQDFELIISDNGSTDRTREICEAYEARDARLCYYRSEQNRGATWNFNRVFELSSGEFFKWAAHDDLLAAEFLEQCIAVLDQDPSVVLCYPKAQIVDVQGNFIEKYDVNLKTNAQSAPVRFGELLLGHLCFDFFGVIRSDAIRKTPLLGNFGHGDGVLLAQLSLIGRFEEIDEYLFFPRKHPKQSMNVYGVYQGRQPNYQNYSVWFDPANAGRILTPHWRILWEFVKTVLGASIRWSERGACLRHVLDWAWRMRRYLVLDVANAAGQIGNRFLGTQKRPVTK